jgi:hypothetical protein
VKALAPAMAMEIPWVKLAEMWMAMVEVFARQS